MLKDLEDLIKTIRDRKNSPEHESYTKKLLNDKNLSVSKVKEEVLRLNCQLVINLCQFRITCLGRGYHRIIRFIK